MKVRVFFASLLVLVLCNPGVSYCDEKKNKEEQTHTYTAYFKDPFDHSISTVEYNLQQVGTSIHLFKFYPGFSTTVSLLGVFEISHPEDTK